MRGPDRAPRRPSAPRVARARATVAAALLANPVMCRQYFGSSPPSLQELRSAGQFAQSVSTTSGGGAGVYMDRPELARLDGMAPKLEYVPLPDAEPRHFPSQSSFIDAQHRLAAAVVAQRRMQQSRASAQRATYRRQMLAEAEDPGRRFRRLTAILGAPSRESSGESWLHYDRTARVSRRDAAMADQLRPLRATKTELDRYHADRVARRESLRRSRYFLLHQRTQEMLVDGFTDPRSPSLLSQRKPLGSMVAGSSYQDSHSFAPHAVHAAVMKEVPRTSGSGWHPVWQLRA